MNILGPFDASSERVPPLPVWLLQTFWGLAAVIGLGLYTAHDVLTRDAVPPTVRLAAASVPRPPLSPIVTGNAVPYPANLAREPLIVHFACDPEDARIARMIDPPPSGRPIVLRLDQSAEEMRSLYRGTHPLFPVDTRIVTTSCTQALIDRGEFP